MWSIPRDMRKWEKGSEKIEVHGQSESMYKCHIVRKGPVIIE